MDNIVQSLSKDKNYEIFTTKVWHKAQLLSKCQCYDSQERYVFLITRPDGTQYVSTLPEIQVIKNVREIRKEHEVWLIVYQATDGSTYSVSLATPSMFKIYNNSFEQFVESYKAYGTILFKECLKVRENVPE